MERRRSHSLMNLKLIVAESGELMEMSDKINKCSEEFLRQLFFFFCVLKRKPSEMRDNNCVYIRRSIVVYQKMFKKKFFMELCVSQRHSRDVAMSIQYVTIIILKEADDDNK